VEAHRRRPTPSSLSLSSNPSHPFKIQWITAADTLSTARFIKEPLNFLSIEPAIHGVKTKRRFAVSKAYSALAKMKIRFQIITKLPLSLFWL
jgi:hypothetical protein